MTHQLILNQRSEIRNQRSVTLASSGFRLLTSVSVIIRVPSVVKNKEFLSRNELEEQCDTKYEPDKQNKR